MKGKRVITALVYPSEELNGLLRMPGDKSISHRVALLAALSDGLSRAEGFLNSEDSRTLLAALEQLGVRHELHEDILTVEAEGGRFRAPADALDMGNSGTGMRLLAGVLAGQPFTSVMTGDASLSRRPMGRIKDPLERMGARVELLGANGRPPVRIYGGALRGVRYELPVASAQVKSCVLLAGLLAQGLTTVVERQPTRDHTERLLQAMGVPIETDGQEIRIQGRGSAMARLPARAWLVPGDFSSAAFWITAAAVQPGRRIEIERVGLNPRRTALLNVLRRMGADILVEPTEEQRACEPVGRIVVRGRALHATEVGGAEIPDLIDELPLAAVAGALAQGRTVIRDAAELRVKESDRIAVMAEHLRAMGVRVEERPDGLAVEGPARLRGGVTVDSRGDHRIPMALSVLAFSGEGPVRMLDVACVAKSYPAFWADLRKVGGRVELDCGD